VGARRALAGGAPRAGGGEVHFHDLGPIVTDHRVRDEFRPRDRGISLVAPELYGLAGPGCIRQLAQLDSVSHERYSTLELQA
jgi:hypothetical protein